MFTHAFADLNNVRLHYVSAGTPGSSPLILCLHGFPEFWYQWRHLMPGLSDDYFIVAPDMRGTNLSDKPAAVDQYQIHHLIDDVQALVEHLGYQQVTLVGHDWGGIVAWAFARTYPTTLENLVIINAPHAATYLREIMLNPAQEEASAYVQDFLDPSAEAELSANGYAALKDILFGNGRFGSQEEIDAYLAAWSQPGALTGALNYYRASIEHNPFTEPDLMPLVVYAPTLVIWGEADEALLPSNLDGLEDYVPDLIIKRIPDGTHWVIHEHPETIIAHIRDFLRSAS